MGDSADEAGGKLGAAVSNRQGAQLAAEEMRSQMQQANIAYQEEMEHLKTSLALHNITEAQKTAGTLAAIKERLDKQLAALDEEAAKAKGNAVKLKQIEDERTKYAEKAVFDRQKAEDGAAVKTAKEWEAAANQVAGAFNSQLKGLLAGTTTWSKAMKNIAADLALKFIESQVKTTAQYLASQASQLTTHVATETAKTTATTTGSTVRTAAELASGKVSVFETIANALKSIYASAGQTASEVSAAVAPEAGPGGAGDRLGGRRRHRRRRHRPCRQRRRRHRLRRAQRLGGHPPGREDHSVGEDVGTVHRRRHGQHRSRSGQRQYLGLGFAKRRTLLP